MAPLLDRLHAQAVRPTHLHWFIFYTSPVEAGLHVASIWSPNCRHVVEGEFLNDFFEKMPSIQFMECLVDAPGA